MKKNAKIYVAGHRGLVGSAILRCLDKKGYSNLLVRTHQELDLTCQKATDEFFAEWRPDYVFLAAAKVGGILANSRYPADFFYENLAIQTNVIHAAYRNQASRLLFLGSSCIYPKMAPQPIKEEYLLSGPLEPTNRPYALAKIAGIEMCSSYNRQFGTQYLAVMPTNLYGPGDNYDLQNSHVIPALISKFCDAMKNEHSHVTVWGSGLQRREFLYSEDLADACVFLMNLPDAAYTKLTKSSLGETELNFPLVNIGFGQDITVHDLAMLIKKYVGYDGRVLFDATRPDGTPRKLLGVSRMNALGWEPQTTLENGLQRTIKEFLNR